MKLLFTTHQGDTAGATFSVYYLASGLATKGHEIHVACDREVLLWQLLEKHQRISLHDTGRIRYLDPRFIGKIKKIVRSFHIDLINAQGGKDRNLVILAKWIFRLKTKIVFTRRQRPRDEPWIKRWFHQRGTDKIVCVSEGLKALFIAKGYSAEHLEVIYNGLPSGLIPSQSDSLAIKEKYGLSGYIIGCVARRKYQKVLIEAAKYLPADWKMLFVGIEKNEVPSTSISSNMIFTGLLPREETLKLYSFMDVMVLPSKMDGFGLVLLEAMQAEVPVIGSDFGGIKDVIKHGQNGLLFNNNDAKGLAELIRNVLEDQAFKNRLVMNGKNTAGHEFTLDRTVSLYEALFSRLIG